MLTSEHARELVALRWKGKNAELGEHVRMMAQVREQRREREREKAQQRLGAKVLQVFARASLDYKYGEKGAYYRLGYRLGIGHLKKSQRSKCIRALELRRETRNNKGVDLRDWERATLDALYDKHTKVNLKLLEDPLVLALVPRSRRAGFLSGLRAGKSGFAMRYHCSRKRIL